MSDHITIAIGPKPARNDWPWFGDELVRLFSTFARVATFSGTLPPCDVAIWVKLLPPAADLSSLAVRNLYCPVNCFQNVAAIRNSVLSFSRIDRVVVDCERIARTIEPLAPVAVIDRAIDSSAPIRNARRKDGPILWIGAGRRLPFLVSWVERFGPVPGELLILTDADGVSRPLPSALRSCRHRVEPWSRARQAEAFLHARGAIEAGGDSWRERRRSASVAAEFIAAGVPTAVNLESWPAEWLFRQGFRVASPSDKRRWLSKRYFDETEAFAAVLRARFSPAVVTVAWQRLIAEVLAERAAPPARLIAHPSEDRFVGGMR